MRMSFVVSPIVVLSVASLGCHRPADAPPPATSSVPTGSAQPIAQDVRGLIGHLRDEAEHRPKVGVTAERLFDALDAAGVTLVSRTQYAGSVMKAAFCAGGRAVDGLVVAMCEYGSDREAEAGLAFMSSTFPIDTATRRAHGAAVMTVVRPPSAASTRVDTAFATFLAL